MATEQQHEKQHEKQQQQGRLYDSSSFTSLASQSTLTDSRAYEKIDEAHEHHETTPTAAEMPRLWRRAAGTLRAKRRKHASVFRPSQDATEHRSSLEDATKKPAATPLVRDNSIITIMSMQRSNTTRRAETNEAEKTGVTHGMLEENHAGHGLAGVDSVEEGLTEKEKQTKIVCLVGQCLLKAGCPCHRVEDALLHIAERFGLDATFSFLPDSVIVTFVHVTTGDTQSVMVKAAPGYDIGKIGLINDIMNAFQKDEMPLDQCLEQLQALTVAPPTVGFWSTLFAFSMSAFTASILLFNGSWIDASVSGALGLLVALLFLLASSFPIYGRVYEISASVIVAIIARALYKYCCFTSVVVSAVLVLLPGYTMTMAVIGLSARHINTGTIQLVYSVIYAFVLAYGLQVGSSVYGALDTNASDEGACGNPVSPWFFIPLFPILSVSLALSFGSSRRQWVSQTCCAAIGFCISYFLGKVIPDSQIVGSIASFAVGLYSNFALKITGEAPLVPLCVGVTLLVPGSIGVRGAYALIHKDDTGHTFFPLQMFTIALGLSAGLFAAGMIVYPTGKKRSLYISL